MNKRLQNRFALHKLTGDHFVPQASLFIGKEGEEGGEGGEGGGGEGKTGDDGKSGEPGAKGGDGDGGKAAGDDGKGKPSDAEAKLLKDLMKQKSAAEAATAEVNRLKEQLKNFDGIDASKVRALLAAAEEDERKKLEAKGEYERLVKQMGERHADELKKAKEEKDAESQQNNALRSQIANLTVGSAFAGSTFVKDDLTLTPTKARVIYGSHFEFKDDKVIGYDKPAGASDRTPLVDATGNPLSFDEALKKIIEADPDKEQLIRSKVRPGAGSTTGKAAAKGDDRKALSSIERIAKGLKALAKD